MTTLDIIFLTLLFGFGVWFIIWCLTKAIDEFTK